MAGTGSLPTWTPGSRTSSRTVTSMRRCSAGAVDAAVVQVALAAGSGCKGGLADDLGCSEAVRQLQRHQLAVHLATLPLPNR
jgi:hypothetical protein